MKSKVIIVGGFHEVIEICEDSGIEIVGIIDNSLVGSYLDYEIIGSDANAIELFQKYKHIPLIITPDIPKIREKLFSLYFKIGYKFSTLVSPSSKISKRSIIGNGVIIQSGVNLSSHVQIGDFVKLNTACNIMHNSTIGDFTTIAPNAVILGCVKIGKQAYLGSNATVLPYLSIGNNTIVGAGAVVTKEIPDGKIFVGNPANELIKNN